MDYFPLWGWVCAVLKMACLAKPRTGHGDAYHGTRRTGPQQLFPRYASEPEHTRSMPVWFYHWNNALPYAEDPHGALRND